MKKVLITGMNVMTPISFTLNEFWDNFKKDTIEGLEQQQIDIDYYANKIRQTRRMNRISKGAFISATQALLDRGLSSGEYEPFDFGCILSASRPSLDSTVDFLSAMYQNGVYLTSPMAFSSSVANACVANLAMNFKLRGSSNLFVSSTAIQNAVMQLRNGRAMGFLCGGYEDFTKETVRCLEHLPYTNHEKDGICSPYADVPKGIYSKERMVSLILEREDSSYLLDNDKVYCEIMSNAVIRKQVSSFEEPMADFCSEDFSRSMQQAIQKACITPKDIDAIIGAAGEHQTLDKAEAQAIASEIGIDVPVLSVKGIYGDTTGSNIFLNVATAAMVLKKQVLPKTYHAGDGYGCIAVNKEEKAGTYQYVLVNGYCEFGNVISVILKKYCE